MALVQPLGVDENGRDVHDVVNQKGVMCGRIGIGRDGSVSEAIMESAALPWVSPVDFGKIVTAPSQ